MSALGDALGHAARMIAFARHMPLRKLVRRTELAARRRVRDRLVSSSEVRSEPLPRAARPLRPLFQPRGAGMTVSGDVLHFRFLDRGLSMPRGAIDWGAPSRSPADQLWRMNLHYLEYLEGLDDDRFEEIALAWIAANPLSRAGAWRDSWNSYALSLRVVVLMQGLAVRAGRLEAGVSEAIAASVAAQLRFLARNLETDIGGNHLIKNIKALVWGSAFFAGREAEGWRATALRLLDQELDRQVLADGTHDERSASYHAQVLADLMECRHALGGDPLGGKLDGAIRRMAQVAADLEHPDGGPVLFNDAGLGMAYAPAECLDVVERLYGERPARRQVFALGDAGYFGYRGPAHYVVADCGRIGPDDLPAHGHGDVLSFEWSVGKQRCVVDQGVFEYIAGARRARARSAANHNTLCFDGADQADFFGAFRCGRRPNVTVRRYEAFADGFVLEGSHDGFSGLAGHPVHVRRFTVDARGIEIEDRIEGRGRLPQARVGALLHPSVEVLREGERVRLKVGESDVLVSSSARLEVVPAVWWPDMGREMATVRLVAELGPEGCLTTRFELLSRDDAA